MSYEAIAYYLCVQAITPGPNNFTCLYLGAKEGFRKASNYILWSQFFLLIKALLCGLLNVALAKSIPQLVNYLKWVGAAYMLYLAGKMALSGWKEQNATQPIKRESYAGTAAMLQLLNVKSWVANLSTFAVYVVPFTTTFIEILIVCGIIYAIVIVASVIWTLFGTSLQSLIEKNKKVFGIVMGVSLVFCAVKVII